MSGITDFTRALVEKVATEKIKADLNRDLKAKAPARYRAARQAKTLSRDNNAKQKGFHDGQVKLF
jgi:hypothetical protein